MRNRDPLSEAIEIDVINPIYKTKQVTSMVDGKKVTAEINVQVKELYVKKWIRKESITSVEEYVTDKGNISKTRSIIFDKFSGKFYAVKHNADAIHFRLKAKTTNKIGFQ